MRSLCAPPLFAPQQSAHAGATEKHELPSFAWPVCCDGWFGAIPWNVPFFPNTLFLSRRVVHSGNRDVVQAEIGAQLTAGMDELVEDEAPDHRRPRQEED